MRGPLSSHQGLLVVLAAKEDWELRRDRSVDVFLLEIPRGHFGEDFVRDGWGGCLASVILRICASGQGKEIAFSLHPPPSPKECSRKGSGPACAYGEIRSYTVRACVVQVGSIKWSVSFRPGGCACASPVHSWFPWLSSWLGGRACMLFSC